MLLKVGTRASPLAVAQAKAVIYKIQENFSNIKCEIVKIQTTGDRLYQADLHLLGGKGLFLKEIEMQLISKEIDIAVHSMKDVPAFTPEGLIIDCVLEREDPRDVFISLNAKSPEELHEGKIVGTCSSRRRAFLQNFYKQVKVENLRGNIETRIRKLHNGIVDAIVIALAGLKRLNMMEHATTVLDVDKFIPAIGQGAIGVECRIDDNKVIEILQSINHTETHCCVLAERAFLKAFGGDCSTPIAAYAKLVDNEIFFNSSFFEINRKKMIYSKLHAKASDAILVGQKAAAEILSLI